MSDGTTCQSCHETATGAEICEHCFAPLSKVVSVHTEIVEPATTLNFESQGRVRTIRQEFQSLKFQRTSPVSRAFSKFVRGLGTLAIAILLTGAPIYWWLDSNADAALEAQAEAISAFEDGHYEESRKAWEEAYDSYAKILDSDGKVLSLNNMARCEIQMKKPASALKILEQSDGLQSSEETTLAINKCCRLIAVGHMDKSKELYKQKLYGEAFLESKEAVVYFQRGEGADYQLAGAHRQASRCSIKLGDHEGAKEELAEAVEYEGRTPANIALGKQIAKSLAMARKEQASAIAKNNYISDEWNPNIQPVRAKIVSPKRRRSVRLSKKSKRSTRRTSGGNYPTAYRPKRRSQSFSPVSSYSGGGGHTSSYNRNRSRSNAQVEAYQSQQRARIQAQNQAIIRQHSSGGYSPPSAPSYNPGPSVPRGPSFP